MMNAGNYNRLLKLQVLTAHDDGAGGTTDGVWQDVFEFFAEVEPMTGYRLLQYGQQVNGKAYVVKTYYMHELTDLTERARLVMENGVELAIHSIVNVGMKNQQFELICDDGR